ncbi:hypothetical protein FQN57_007014 [Myotisia sp. PD_48]|nr:hypothetical protein FQN57_007014 [Myotisia sp. PD_48]
MKSHLFFLSILALVAVVCSQKASVPPELSEGFDLKNVNFQVTFGGDSSEGLRNGDTVPTKSAHANYLYHFLQCIARSHSANNRADISNTPDFALGESSGINVHVSHSIMMLDTTDPKKMTIQFLQSAFKPTMDRTKLGAKTPPEFPYRIPGSDGETGRREYSFLLHLHRGEAPFQGIPRVGEIFDVERVKRFESQNGLKRAIAGMAVSVRLNRGRRGVRRNSSSITSTFITSSSPSASLSTVQSHSIAPLSSGLTTVDDRAIFTLTISIPLNATHGLSSSRTYVPSSTVQTSSASTSTRGYTSDTSSSLATQTAHQNFVTRTHTFWTTGLLVTPVPRPSSTSVQKGAAGVLKFSDISKGLVLGVIFLNFVCAAVL